MQFLQESELMTDPKRKRVSVKAWGIKYKNGKLDRDNIWSSKARACWNRDDGEKAVRVEIREVSDDRR